MQTIFILFKKKGGGGRESLEKRESGTAGIQNVTQAI